MRTSWNTVSNFVTVPPCYKKIVLPFQLSSVQFFRFYVAMAATTGEAALKYGILKVPGFLKATDDFIMTHGALEAVNLIPS